MKKKIKIIRTSTVPISLNLLLKGQLKYLNNYFEVIGVSSPGTDLKITQKREGVKTHSIAITRNISIISDIVSLWKLYIYFKKEKPQIVHSITPKAGLLSMTAAYVAKVPIRIHTYTGLVFPSKKGFLQKVLIVMDKILCYFATNIYPEGKGVKNDLINYNITNKKLNIIANGNVNGINTTEFNPNQFTPNQKEELKQQLNINPNDFIFVFVGRLVGDKGINELITAFETLSSTNANIKLLLVGNEEPELDPLLPKTQKTIKENKQIITTGWVDDVRPYLAIANVFVFPSYREGFPNVVMQAGAMELPSIVTNINGSNEIITDGYNGLVIPPKNTEALQVAMQKLLSNKTLTNQLAQNARPNITSKYEQKIVWQALLKEYERLLSVT